VSPNIGSPLMDSPAVTLSWAAATGVADPQALADAPIVLYNGALATANTAKPARTAGITAGA
jgi:hypothetical protein